MFIFSNFWILDMLWDFQLENNLSPSSPYNMENNLDKTVCQFASLHPRRKEPANILPKWLRNPGKGT